MPSRHRPRRLTCLNLVFVCALLVSVTACGNEPGNEEPPALTASNTPETRTFDPSPAPQGEEQTSTIRLGSQDWVSDLRIAISSTNGGEVRFRVSQGPDIAPDDGVSGQGEVGESIGLDNGYTITIDEIVTPEPGGDAGGGNAGATITVTPPEG